MKALVLCLLLASCAPEGSIYANENTYEQLYNVAFELHDTAHMVFYSEKLAEAYKNRDTILYRKWLNASRLKIE